MPDDGRRTGLRPTDVVFVLVPFAAALLWSGLDAGYWNWTSALFNGVVIGGAAILGQTARRKRLRRG